MSVMKKFLFQYAAPLVAGACAAAAGLIAAANIPMTAALIMASVLLLSASLPFGVIPIGSLVPRQ